MYGAHTGRVEGETLRVGSLFPISSQVTYVNAQQGHWTESVCSPPAHLTSSSLEEALHPTRHAYTLGKSSET